MMGLNFTFEAWTEVVAVLLALFFFFLNPCFLFVLGFFTIDVLRGTDRSMKIEYQAYVTVKPEFYYIVYV